MQQFAAALIARDRPPPASAILAYQADNELFFEANQAPYDKMSGTVKPLNGVTYDMSIPRAAPAVGRREHGRVQPPDEARRCAPATRKR